MNEGESITLNTSVETNQQKNIRWYLTLENDILIAEIAGAQSKICTDQQCEERFGNRLQYKTGSLTIKGTRPTDSGVYKLKINSSRFSSKVFIVNVHSESLCNHVTSLMCLLMFLSDRVFSSLPAF